MIFTSEHIRLVKRLILLLLPYSMLRIGFFFYHYDIYKEFTKTEILMSLLYGIRFDIAGICLMNISIILLSLIPISKSHFIKLERILFTVVNTIGFVMTLNDFELFLFMGKRLSFDIFAVTGDIVDQLPQIISYYWYFPLASILLGAGLYFFDKNFLGFKIAPVAWKKKYVGGVLVLGLSFIGIRGGLQHKSINVQSAFIQGKNELGHLVLNTPYHFLRTLKNKSLEKVKYFKTDDEAKKFILNAREFPNGFEKPGKYNVVLLILESFSLEYIEKGHTPFLKSLMAKSLTFNKHLANGRRSIEVLPSILCGLPSLINDPISKSIYSGNKFVCMPKLLKSAGYTNYFFHGGSKGTMGFESYTLSNGFDKYFSKEDYPGEDYDGTWGIYDEPYLKYAAKEISKMREPFLAGIFTLSSHQPYSVPLKYKDVFNKGTLEIHESIEYTDFSLKTFFETIKNEPWFKNTIFVITSDHTQKHETKKFQNLVGHYRVPLVIHSPAITFPAMDKVSQHSDIPKTILDMVGVDFSEMPLTGVSLFSQDPGAAINFADGTTYFLVQGNNVQTLGAGMNLDWDTGVLTSSVSDPQLLKAYLQYFKNGLINNNLSQ
jgi:phosphoglycerol transferase MdoB-like AlkP superfamily enzyme